MSKKLFIVEAPGKVAKIRGYLGKGYEVLPSVGHTHYLPTKNYVDFKKDFELLVCPGENHGTRGPAADYVERRKHDFFVRYLLGDEVPGKKHIGRGIIRNNLIAPTL